MCDILIHIYTQLQRLCLAGFMGKWGPPHTRPVAQAIHCSLWRELQSISQVLLPRHPCPPTSPHRHRMACPALRIFALLALGVFIPVCLSEALGWSLLQALLLRPPYVCVVVVVVLGGGELRDTFPHWLTTKYFSTPSPPPSLSPPFPLVSLLSRHYQSIFFKLYQQCDRPSLYQSTCPSTCELFHGVTGESVLSQFYILPCIISIMICYNLI